MLLALIACSPGDVIIGQGDKPGTDETSSLDTDTTDSGTDTDTTTPPDPEPLCGHLSGIAAAGTRWEYASAYDQPQYEVSRVATVTDMQDGIARVSDIIQYIYTGGAYTYEYTYDYEYVYNCDADGVWLLGQSTVYTTQYNENETVNEIQLELDEPVLTYPLDAALGDGWDMVYNGRQLSNGNETPYRMQYHVSVIGQEDLQVQMGTVPAWRLMSEYNNTPYQTWYVGTDIGVVEDQTWSILSYAP